MGDNKTPITASSSEPSAPTPGSRLVRRSPSPMALEQRFVFDGAAAADVVDTATTLAEPTPQAAEPLSENLLLAAYGPVAEPPSISAESNAPEAATSALPADDGSLFHQGEDNAALAEAATAATQLIQNYLAEASDEQLFALFHGEQSSPDAQWSANLAQLRDAVANGTLDISLTLLDNVQLKGALAAYAPEGPQGTATIFINSDWLNVLDVQKVSSLLIEEYGHHIDHILNQGVDTAGDEGQRFAAVVTGADTSAAGFATDNDHRTLQIDGESIEVELAQLSFGNAYAVNVATTPAGKESNSHDFVFTSLGTATISDDTNSNLFSGNDVAAIGISIGGEEYFGWISRPIKSNGVVRGFYFWTDTDFVDLATAQADGNADGDRNVADNLGFLLVVDQAWFDSIGWKDQAANLKNVGSSSDRVDSALNALIPGSAAPVAVADVAIAIEAGGPDNATPGSDATGNVLDNDSDANGDSLSVTAVTSNATASSSTIASGSSAVVSGQYGQLTLGANGAYTYVVDNANAAVQALLSSANTLSDTFTYRISDGNGGSATTTLTVSIQGANDNPTASDDYNLAKESLLTNGAYASDDPLGSRASGNVLSNDTDPDRYGESQAVTGVGIEGAATGTTTATQTILSFTTLPSNVSAGYYVFLDGDGLDNDKNAGTALRDANGNPITITSIDTTAKTFTLSGTVANATLSQNGSQLLGFANNSAGTAAYKDEYIQSSTNAAGTQVSISAPQGTIAVGMSVGGTGLGTAPTVTAVNYDGSGNISAITLSSAVALSNQALTFSAGADAGTTLIGQYGTLLLNADGSYTYTPTANNPALAAGQSGLERFDYTMRDGAGATSSASLFITVLGSGANDPNAMADSITATEQGGVANATPGVDPSGNLLSNDTTPSGSLTIVGARSTSAASDTTIGAGDSQIAGLHGTLTLRADGTYSYTVNNDSATVQALNSTESLTDTFVYTVENGLSANGTLLKDSATLTVTIQGANDTPLAADDSAAAIEAGGTGNAIAGYDPVGNVLSNDNDIDDAASDLRVTAVRTGNIEGAGSAGTIGSAIAGSYGSLTLEADGSWSYVVDQSSSAVNALAPGQTLTESFNYTVTDRSGSGLSDTAVLTITIQGASDTVAVNDVFVNEGSPYAVFTVTGGAGVQVELALDAAGLPATDVRATLGTDVGTQIEYFDGSGWAAYDAGNPPSIPGSGQLLVRVAVHQDDVHEGNESFRLIATTSDGSESAGIGTINDEGEGDIYLAGNTSGTPDSAALDDDRPTLSVANVSVAEGDPAEFVVSIDKRSTAPISFTPLLGSGTAIIGSDTAAASALQYYNGTTWVAVSGPVTIAAGELSVRLRLATVDDSEVEPDQSFILSTGNVSGTVTNPLGATGTATIVDNDVAVVGTPELDLDADDSSTATGADYRTLYTENGSTVAIADSDLLIVDADSANLASATVVLSNAKAGDTLSVGTLPAGITATVDTSVAGKITVTLSGSASKADYQAAIRAVAFSNGSDDPDTSDRLVVVQVSDGVNESNSALTTIQVLALNDAPVLADTALSISVAEDAGTPSGAVGSPLSAFTGGISDPDSNAQKGVAIIGSDESHGTWYYTTDGGTTWQTVDSVSETNALLLADNASTRLYFQPADDFNGSIAAGLTFKAWDRSCGTAGDRADTTLPAPSNNYTSIDPIVIPGSGSSGSVTLSSTLNVSDLTGPITGVTVTLTGLSHGWSQDLDILLVGPRGQQVLLMSDAGGGNALSNLTLTFDDAAASALPDVGQPLTSGTFRPTDLADGEGGDTFTGITGPFDSSLSAFIGGDPNGVWTLYVADDVVAYDGGSLASWTLTLHTPIDGSAFSTASDSIAVTVTPLNDAPLASGSASLAAVAEDETDPPGASIGSLFASSFDDSTDQVDGGSSANSLAGIAITGYTADAAKGDWQYSTDSGNSWTTLSGIAGDGSALTLQASALLRFLPAADYNGAAPDLTVRLIDSSTSVSNAASVDASLNGGSTAISAETVVLSTNVTAMPDPAVIGGDDAGTVTEDAGVDTDGNLTDAGQLTISDADDGEAQFQTTVVAAPGTLGSLTIDANGAWSYSVANAAAQYLKAGETKVETFTVKAVDGTEQQVQVVITGVNDAPVGADQTTSTAEDTPVSGQVTASDVDGDSLTFAKASAPAQGSVTVAADGSWTYTPNPDYHGSDSFTVAVSDGQGGSDTITVDVTVTPVNDAPVGQSDTAFISEGTTSMVDSVLENDTDADLDSLVVTQFASDIGGMSAEANGSNAITTALGGTVVMNVDGSFSYVAPVLNHSGASQQTDSFVYRSSDGELQSGWTTVNVVVYDSAPRANDDQDSAAIGATVTGNVITGAGGNTPGGADTFIDAPTTITSITYNGMTYSIPAGGRTLVATNGTLVIRQDGSYSYTAKNQPISMGSSAPVDRFEYRLVDGDGTISAPATLTITTDNSYSFTYAENQAIGTVLGTVAVSDSLSYAITGGNADGYFAINSAGQISLTAAGAASLANDYEALGNLHSLTVTATSSGGTTLDIAVTLAETNRNDAPVNSLPANYSMDEDNTLRLSGLSVADVDAGGGVISVTLSVSRGTITAADANGVTVTGSGSASVVLSGTLADINDYLAAPATQPRYTPLTDDSGTVSLTMTSNDLGNTGPGGALTDTDSIDITINPVADALQGNDVALLIGAPATNTLDFRSSITGLQNKNNYSFPSGILLSTGDPTNTFNWSSGNLLGVSAPGENGTQSQRINGTDKIELNFPTGMQYMALKLKNAGNDSILIRSDLQVGELTGGVLSGNIASSSGLTISSANLKVELVVEVAGMATPVTVAATVSSGGTWSVSYGGVTGTITKATVVAYLDGSLFNQGGNTLADISYSISSDMQSLSIAQDTLNTYNQNNDGFQIQYIDLSADPSGITTYTYPVDLYGVIRDAVGTPEAFTGLTLSDLPAGVAVSVWDADNNAYREIAPDAQGVYDLSAYTELLSTPTALGSDKIYLVSTGQLPSGFVPTLSIEIRDGASVAKTILGGSADSTFTGSAGNDYISGGAGNDTLIGGEGDDILLGGAGADRFVWQAGDTGRDVIKDFNVGEGDRIDLSELLQGENALNILDYLRVDTATSTLQISTTGALAADGSNADVTISLENGGAAVGLNPGGLSHADLVSSLIAGADPVIKID